LRKSRGKDNAQDMGKAATWEGDDIAVPSHFGGTVLGGGITDRYLPVSAVD
jgi:hypothetical protein